MTISREQHAALETGAADDEQLVALAAAISRRWLQVLQASVGIGVMGAAFYLLHTISVAPPEVDLLAAARASGVAASETLAIQWGLIAVGFAIPLARVSSNTPWRQQPQPRVVDDHVVRSATLLIAMMAAACSVYMTLLLLLGPAREVPVVGISVLISVVLCALVGLQGPLTVAVELALSSNRRALSRLNAATSGFDCGRVAARALVSVSVFATIVVAVGMAPATWGQLLFALVHTAVLLLLVPCALFLGAEGRVDSVASGRGPVRSVPSTIFGSLPLAGIGGSWAAIAWLVEGWSGGLWVSLSLASIAWVSLREARELWWLPGLMQMWRLLRRKAGMEKTIARQEGLLLTARE